MASDKAVKTALAQILLVGGTANASNTPKETLVEWQKMSINSAYVREIAKGSGCQECSDKRCRAGSVMFTITTAGKEFLQQ